MAWDLKINQSNGDLAGGYVTGQAEILQRVVERLYRQLGEWFCNTSAGLPWYRGPSNILPGQLTEETAILGSRDFNAADIWIRNEIADTEGVIQVLDFNAFLDHSTRVYSVRAKIVTRYGLPELVKIDWDTINNKAEAS
jgi:hypothetical protein